MGQRRVAPTGLVESLISVENRGAGLAEAGNMMTAHPGLAGLFADNESSTVGTVQAAGKRRLARDPASAFPRPR